jgi:bifunctional lysine-specific demethylase and histidyl-hydroxylase NO66
LVYRRAHGPVAVRHQDDGRLRLTLGDRRLLLPGPLEPAVRRLLDGNRRPVGDLADLLDADSRRVLVRRLVQEGVLRTDTRAGTAGG